MDLKGALYLKKQVLPSSATPNKLQTRKMKSSPNPSPPSPVPRAQVSHQIQVEPNKLQPRHQGQKKSQVIVTADQGIPARHTKSNLGISELVISLAQPPQKAYSVEIGCMTAHPWRAPSSLRQAWSLSGCEAYQHLQRWAWRSVAAMNTLSLECPQQRGKANTGHLVSMGLGQTPDCLQSPAGTLGENSELSWRKPPDCQQDPKALCHHCQALGV